MDTIGSSFRVYESRGLRVQTTTLIALPDIIIYGALDGATRAQQVENLVTCGITDKASYLSETITLHLLFLSILPISLYNQSSANI